MRYTSQQMISGKLVSNLKYKSTRKVLTDFNLRWETQQGCSSLLPLVFNIIFEDLEL